MFGYIYKITNTLDGKIYVGKTSKTIEKRYAEHLKNAKRGVRYVSYLYRAMSACGVENFVVEEIEKCDLSIIDERERYWIKFLNSQDPHIGYNIQEGGNGGATRSSEFHLTEKQLIALENGRHLPSSDKQKERLSARRKGCEVSAETREKLRKAQTGKKASEETRRKLSEQRKGRKMPSRTDEQRQAYREGSLGRVRIHKGTVNRNPKKSELDKYLSEGWELGYHK